MEQVPAALRVGSSVVGRRDSQPEQRPALRRPSSISSDRVSQFFPSRQSSISSLGSPAPEDRRYSYPSPPAAPPEPAYRIPQAPAPPSFPYSTAYEPTASSFEASRGQPAQNVSRTRTLLGQLSRLSSSRKPKTSGYGKLGDDESLPRNTRGRDLDKVEEEDEHHSLGIDMSAFEGPIALRDLHMKKSTSVKVTESEPQLTPSEAGLMAEFQRLEARDGHLGGGMDVIKEVPSLGYGSPNVAQVSRQATHRRIPSADLRTRQDAQREAEKTGEILAVPETPGVDISNLGGGDYDSGSMLTMSAVEKEKSYFFPPDPSMPNWKPLSMHWPYITMLIVAALGLAALQEFVCQMSIRKAANDDGLLKFKAAADLTLAQYFTWKYAPIMVFVFYGVLWQIADYEVKRLEPFYQLSKKTGATAEESINIDYLTFIAYFIPLKAIRHRHWSVALSSIGTLICGSVVPVLQSASVDMYPPKEQRRDDDFKFVRIDPPWSRAMSACLVFAALCGIFLLFQLRRKTGLINDPKGIAGLASMAVKSHILMDFQGLDTAPSHVIHRKLRNRRYILHKSTLWQGEYIRNNTKEVKGKRTRNPLPVMMTLTAGIPFIIFILCIAILIPIFMFVGQANIVTDKVPWLLTALATVIKLLWGTLDCDVRMMEPFYILSRRHAPPATLTLDYTGTIPGWLPIKAALKQHWIVAMVGLGAVLTEFLTVCVSSLSVDGRKFFFMDNGGGPNDDGDGGSDRFNSGETLNSFWVSLSLVSFILVSLAVIASITYTYRRRPFLPRAPGTIASVLAYIHQSKMLEKFVDTEKYNAGQMTKYLERRFDKTYALGWFQGRDGEDHCGIDEEEILAPFEHGKDWTASRLRGVSIGAWETYD